eukprot:jgi/Orpsp1_1/1184639/evm.model.c7180000090355.2
MNLPISHNQTLFSAFCSCSAHEASNYERLENLGDSFIKFAVSIDIFRKYPNLDEGGMTYHRGKIVCNKNLYEISIKRNFDALMFVNAFNPKIWYPPKVITPYSTTTTTTTNNNSINDDIVMILDNTTKKIDSSSILVNEPLSMIDSSNPLPKGSINKTKEDMIKPSISKSNSVNSENSYSEQVGTPLSTPPTKSKSSRKKSKKSDSSVSLYQSTKGPLYRVISKKTLADFIESLTAAYYVESGLNTAIKFCNIIGLISENTSQCFKASHNKQGLSEESLDKLKLAQSVINSNVDRFSIIYKHLYQAKYNDIKKRKFNNDFYDANNSLMINDMENNNLQEPPSKKRRRKKSKHQRLSSASSIEMNYDQGSNYSLIGTSSNQVESSPINNDNNNYNDTDDTNDTFNKTKDHNTLLQINENIENKLKLFYHSRIRNQKDKSLLYLAKIFPFDAIEEKLHYHFNNRLYLVEAFTHASYTTVITHNYERLEFLGDATLDWILQRFFFLTYPSASAAELSELRQAAVNNESLARLSIGLGYHYYLMHHSVSLQNEIRMYIDMLEKKLYHHHNYQQSQQQQQQQQQQQTQNKKNLNKKNNKMNSKKKDEISANSSTSNNKLNTFTTDDAFQHPLQSTYEGPKVLGDLFEAVIGAVLVDSNYNVATVWRVFRPLLSDFLDKHASPENLNQST